jgi:outer membrane protein TolC
MLALALAAALVAAPERSADSPKVKELQKERIAILQKTEELTLKLAQAGRIDLGELVQSRTLLLKAELDAAEKVADRVTLYKKALDSLKAYEALAKNQFAAGRATELPILKIRAARLEAEIALERLDAK